MKKKETFIISQQYYRQGFGWESKYPLSKQYSEIYLGVQILLLALEIRQFCNTSTFIGHFIVTNMNLILNLPIFYDFRTEPHLCFISVRIRLSTHCFLMPRLLLKAELKKKVFLFIKNMRIFSGVPASNHKSCQTSKFLTVQGSMATKVLWQN